MLLLLVNVPNRKFHHYCTVARLAPGAGVGLLGGLFHPRARWFFGPPDNGVCQRVERLFY
ncbi:sensory box histidine kinase [Anopheles sinensis]|uniref:Sensory box histidine kinase n=1 Tax=Anopheles sinensis TaxID=74873 RepID=A0A084WV14_ANOSI|nr:sensory box histidine kinase [Anopheles sinensis]